MSVGLTAAGMAILVYAIWFFICDCKGNVSATMGGEMSFSAYWAIGLIMSSLGFLPIIGISRWWTFLTVPVLYVASFPMRVMIEKMVCDKLAITPTGFQRYIRKIEGTEKAEHQDGMSDNGPPGDSPSASS